ncbi:hypothetical protein HDV06_001126 [Boothiomyces sp. JEL0866]|nr:hypothetical protein HDV06_001126 [Boothiomyces sp. JEL0866]
MDVSKSIEDYIENDKIPSKYWKRMKSDERLYILDLIEDGIYSENILCDIHPLNRRMNLPREYSDNQREYINQNVDIMHSPSRNSVDITNRMIQEEVKQLLEGNKKLYEDLEKVIKEKDDIIKEKSYTRSYEGFGYMKDTLETVLYEDEDFTLFEGFGKYGLNEVVVQPKVADVTSADFYLCLEKIFESDNPLLKEIINGNQCGVTLTVLDLDVPGMYRYFTFSLADMGLERLMYQLKRALLMGEDEDGSDTYKFINKNVLNVSIKTFGDTIGGSDIQIGKKNKKFKTNKKFKIEQKTGKNGVGYSYLMYDDEPDTKIYLMCYYDEHFNNFKDFRKIKFCIKCLSEEHTYEDVINNSHIKLECLNILQKQIPKEDYEKEMPDRLYISYDYETHTNNTKHYTHSVAFKIYNPSTKETTENYFEGFNVERKFVNYLNKNYKKYIKFLFAYNGSNFDHYFTATALSNTLTFKINSDTSIIAKNKMLKIQSNGFVLWDPYNFCKSSLKDACKAFDVEETKTYLNIDSLKILIKKYQWDDFDDNDEYIKKHQHEIISKLFEHYQYKDNIFDSDDWFSLNNKEYNMNDAEINMQLFWKLKKEFKKSTKINQGDKGLNIEHFPTISSLVYRFFNPKFTKIDTKYNYIFDSILGGRTQAFEVGHFTDTYALLDINSSYPSIQINYPMPDGKIIESENLDKQYNGKIYMCLCDVDQENLKIKYIGEKYDNKPNNWNLSKVTNTWLWKEEIEELEKYGLLLEKKKYIIWENDTMQLKPIQEFLREKRLALKCNIQKCQELLDVIFTDVILRRFDFKFKEFEIIKRSVLENDKIYDNFGKNNELFEFVNNFYNFNNPNIVVKNKELYNLIQIYKNNELEFFGKYLPQNSNYKNLINERNKYKIQERLIKLQSNGFSGKCIEKNHLDIWKITTNQKVKQQIASWRQRYKNVVDFEILGEEKFLLKGKKEEPKYINKPRHWGARILALGRLELWKEMNKYSNVKYCDTDSILVPLKEIRLEQLSSIEYGKWKIETITNNFYIISPKSYWLNENKNSLKGYSSEDMWEVREKLPIEKENIKNYGKIGRKDQYKVKTLHLDTISFPQTEIIDNVKKYYLYYNDKDNIIDCGKGRTEILYKYLLDDNVLVLTTFIKFTRQFIKKEDSNEYKKLKKYTLAIIKSKEIRKILKDLHNNVVKVYIDSFTYTRQLRINEIFRNNNINRFSETLLKTMLWEDIEVFGYTDDKVVNDIYFAFSHVPRIVAVKKRPEDKSQ